MGSQMAELRGYSQQLTELGKQVATSRRRRGMSQSALADASGVNRVTISRLERGLLDVGVLRLLAVAEALDCAPGELLRFPPR